MLIDFSVENYRSIADKQTISFVASEHRSDAEGQAVVACEGLRSQKLLTSAVIYGANASGKSNLLRALGEFALRVRSSATPGPHEIRPFLLDAAWAKRPTLFEFSFMMAGVRYEYGFSLDAERIIEEWLIAHPRRTPQVWFERRMKGKRQEVRFGPSLKGEKARIYEMTRPDALFLSVAAQFNHKQLTPIADWIRRIIVMQASFISPEHTVNVSEISDSHKDTVRKFLRAADVGIEGFSVRRHAPVRDAASSVGFGHVKSSRKEGELLEITMEHKGADGERIAFNLFEESQGTGRYFSLLGPIVLVLRYGGMFVVDELDDSLHPLLVREIIRLFHDPKRNKSKAQLLFNTHDTTLLDPHLFRRDQVWFSEKDAGGKTRLYSLLDFSPRKNESLQNGYLQGRYGAVPYLGHFAFADAASPEGEGEEQ